MALKSGYRMGKQEFEKMYNPSHNGVKIQKKI